MTKKAPSALMQPVEVSAELAAIVGQGPYSRSEIIKLLWVYIKANGLQNKKTITPDEKLGKVLGSKPIDMFAMTKEVSKHIKKKA